MARRTRNPKPAPKPPVKPPEPVLSLALAGCVPPVPDGAVPGWTFEPQRRIVGHDKPVWVLDADLPTWQRAGELLDGNRVYADAHWNDGQTGQALKARVAAGTDTDAAAVMDRFIQTLPIDVEADDWETRTMPHGYAPNVPAFLAGQPMTMFNRERLTSEGGAIRIYVSTTSSCGISAQYLQRRAGAVMALCQKLAAHRPVEVFVIQSETNYSSKDDFMIFTRVGTAPLDLGRAGLFLANIGFTRDLGYSMRNGCRNINWCSLADGHGVKLHAEADGVKALHVPSPFLDNMHHFASDDAAAAWVHEQTTKALAGEGEAFEDNLAKCGG